MSDDKSFDEILSAASDRTSISAALLRLQQRASLSGRDIAKRVPRGVEGMSKTTVADVLAQRKVVPSREFAVTVAKICRATEPEVAQLKETWDRVQHVNAPPAADKPGIPGQRHSESNDTAAEFERERHLATLKVMAEAAGDLNNPDEYRIAQRLYERVFIARSELLGETDEQTLNAAHNLGVVLGLLDDMPAARRLLGLAFQFRRDTLGPMHPATLSSMENLAGAQLSMGFHRTARDLLEECLARRREAVAEADELERPAAIAKFRNTAEKLLHLLKEFGDRGAADALRAELSR